MSLQNKGLDYFSLDVDFFDNDKIALIEAEHGAEATLISLKLLCKIYKEGYYYYWNKDASLLFCRKVGAEMQFVETIIQSLLKRDFLDIDLFRKYSILTSRGIQERFFEATGRRRKIEVNKDFLLIDVSNYKNVCALSPNVDIEVGSSNPNVNIEVGSSNPNVDIFKQSKVKESKVNIQQQQQQQHACEEPKSEDPGKERESWKESLLADEDWRATIVRYSGKGAAVLQYVREAMAVFDDYLRLSFKLDTVHSKKEYSQSFIGWWRYHNFNLKMEELSGGAPKNVPRTVSQSGRPSPPERRSKIEELMETGKRATEIAMKIYNSQAV
ncbi:DUF4373 domain-containing protein [Parabacteroides sp.]